ncbi:hypothetical protein [Fulvivirga lutea]|uniref:Uncharacterized protein n=1 Tax=Fulvivirga lutea TaxID=2810512 RepID=A0A974WL62_9BACT|nr:hypothetical protein [Fulvivirga lutea]QSE99257.1 hypothetical protein JR347_09255 [Fulvivirga lutea]
MNESEEKKGFKDLLFEVILPKVELISLVLVLVSIVFKMLHLQGTPELLMISLSTYAVVCFLRGYQPIDSDSTLDKIIVKFGGVGSAILVIGVLFLMLSLPGYSEMLWIGGVTFGITMGLIIVKSSNRESELYKKLVSQYLKTLAVVSVVYYSSYLL